MIKTLIVLAAFMAADAPKTIPDGVKVQFFVASNQLTEANKKAQALVDADPKLKKAFDDVENARKLITVAIDNGRKACGGPVNVVGGDLKCVPAGSSTESKPSR